MLGAQDTWVHYILPTPPPQSGGQVSRGSVLAVRKSHWGGFREGMRGPLGEAEGMRS